MAELAPRKNKTVATHSRHAWRNNDGTLCVSEDMRKTRAKEPIFGPAVPEGEEFEYTVFVCETQAEVREEISRCMYDVLNGFLPQQKGEFALRALSQMSKSISLETKGAEVGGLAAELVEYLQDNQRAPASVDAQLRQFQEMAIASDAKSRE